MTDCLYKFFYNYNCILTIKQLKSLFQYNICYILWHDAYTVCDSSNTMPCEDIYNLLLIIHCSQFIIA